MIVHDGDGVTNEEQASKLLKSYAKSNEKEEGDRKRKKLWRNILHYFKVQS
jgi:hypothetical protein